ncbi:MAG: glycoside hydrolase family 3 protein [Dermatophilaceae bacterium]|nr:glycoside hydrolase family 3 protein [Dermatophilaceae bacterium]
MGSRRLVLTCVAACSAAALVPGPGASAVTGVTAVTAVTGQLATPSAAIFPAADPAAAPAATTPAVTAQAVLNRLTTAQRIGQLFMVGGSVKGLPTATRTAISRYHVGNLILTGRTTAGAAPVRALTAGAQSMTTNAATSAVPLLVASDQEGGLVQVLQGPWFSRMPTALTQGTFTDAGLTRSATVWGSQVLRAGVNVNLAPVMDTVSAAFAPLNAPIGALQREFGHTPAVVAEKGSAFVRGMRSTGMALTAKHFPGLGRVTGNTDTTAGVTDRVTTRTSPDIGPFRSAVGAGAQLLMVSSAIYSRIDAARPAVFSPTVITGMIRGDLRFGGVVISDDLGAARAVQAWSPGTRAVNFLNAGGDVVLTVDPTVVPAMVNAVTARVTTNATFRARVNAAALRVLTVKAANGLLGTRIAVTGSLSTSTISSLQRWLGVTRTGTLGSATIRALQVRVNVPATGVWGSRSMGALQSYLGIAHDGATTWNTRTVRQLQSYLNTQL